MKRSEALAPLSRDHHVALEAALRLRRAEPETAASAVERFRAFWAKHGLRHFEIEEELLLTALPDDDPTWSYACARVRCEHDELRRAAADATAGDPERLRELGQRLHDHVRFEERELFPLLEARLAPEELAALGRRVEAAEGRS